MKTLATLLLAFICLCGFYGAASAEPCLMTTDEKAAMIAETPEAVIAALADAQAYKPKIQRFRGRLIINIDIQKMRDGLPPSVSGPMESFVEGVRQLAVHERFALFICDTVRPIFDKFKEFEVVEVHGYLEVRDERRGDTYQQKQMWAAYRRETASRIQWFEPDRRHPLDIITKADGYSLKPSIEFGRF